MKKSKTFYTDAYKKIEDDILRFINSHKEFMSEETISSTRAAGDAIQGILADNFDNILGELCGTYSAEFARRAMADIAFTNTDGSTMLLMSKLSGSILISIRQTSLLSSGSHDSMKTTTTTSFY